MKEYKRKAVILGIIIVSLTVIGGISSYLISLNKDKATATQIEVAQDNILSEEISITAQTVAVDGDTVLETNTGNDAETNQDNGSTKENEINEQTDDNHIFTLDKAVAYSVCYMESEIFGEVTFALGFDSKDSFQIGLFKDDNLVYQIDTEFDAILGDSYTKSTLKPDFHAVSFEDVNADGLNDISVIIETYTNRYEYISFNFLQDKESNGFIFNTEFNEYLATKKPNFPVEIMSLGKIYYRQAFLIAQGILSEEEVANMSFEERVQAFKDNKLAVQIATSNYYGKAGEEDTLNTIIYNYYNEYVYDDFSTYPTTTFSTYKGNKTDYLVLEIAHDGTMYDGTIILLFKNTDDALVLIDEYEEWNRVHINIYDGIVIEEHCYEGIASRTMVKYLDENEICHQLYNLDSFLMNYYPYLSDELKALKNKIGELGLSNDFLDMLFVRTLSVNDCYYVQFEIEDLYDETSANTYLEYKKEFDILKEIYQSSDMPPSYIYCDPDVDIMNYATDYLTALGLTI